MNTSTHSEPKNTLPIFLDMKTIEDRVARIKASWSPETAKERAAEGARRRRFLEDLFLDRLCDTDASEESCSLEEHGFSLVG